MAAKKKKTRKKAHKAAPRKAPARRNTDTQKKGAGPGRKPFKPTDEQRIQVKMLIGLGLTYREISSVIINPTTRKGVSVNTLQKHFADELEDGAGFVKSRITQSLFRKAIGDSPQSAVCAMFIAKCRFGWRQEDKIVHEVEGNTGVLVAPAMMSPEDWIAAAQKDNEGKEPPTGSND